MNVILLRSLRAVFLLAALFSLARSGDAATQPTGQITGTIVDASSKAVNHAFVTALIQPTSISTPSFSATAVTGTNGKFTLTAIPDGTFTICVQVAGSNYLNPCQWSSTPPAAVVANGQSVSLAAIQLVLGYRYQVRFNDPTGAVAQAGASKSGAQLLLFAWAKSASAPFLWGSTDATGTVYQALIPFGTAIRMTLQGQKYHIVDQTGAAVNLAGGVTLSVNMPAPVATTVAATTTSTAGPDLTYQITKVDP